MEDEMTAQARMEALLKKSGLPAKEIKVFGSQIIVTCFSRDAADKWALLISRFAKVRGPVESIEVLKDQHAAYARANNPGLVKTFTRPLWLVGGAIQTPA